MQFEEEHSSLIYEHPTPIDSNNISRDFSSTSSKYQSIKY